MNSRQTGARRMTRWIGMLMTAGALGAAACAERDSGGGATGTVAQDDAGLPAIQLERAYSKLTFQRPVQLVHDGAHDDRLYVVEQNGKIKVFDRRDDVETASVFLDLTADVYRGHNEEGLLSLAFHPEFEANRRFYVFYSAGKTAEKARRGVIAEFTTTEDDIRVADLSSRRVILEVDQPWGNHNGSTVLFGPDGMLYASFGDGGAANDPLKAGQDLSNLLGTVVRVDVDQRGPNGEAYAVPSDNPFVDRDGAMPEIWAYGLRNIWRMSFDRETGALWAGDVGQNRYEEIDVIVRGGNYGWNLREGKHNFARGESADELIDPVVEYGRRLGISVTGGYVYRGSAYPALDGLYLFGDYVSGRIWAVRMNGDEVVEYDEVLERRSRPHIASFGEDPDGELYICTFDHLDGRGGSSGRLFRITTR